MVFELLPRQIKIQEGTTKLGHDEVTVVVSEKFTKITHNGIDLFFARDNGEFTGSGTSEPELMGRYEEVKA